MVRGLLPGLAREGAGKRTAEVLTFSLLPAAQGASLTTKPLDGALASSWAGGFMYACRASESTTSASCRASRKGNSRKESQKLHWDPHQVALLPWMVSGTSSLPYLPGVRPALASRDEQLLHAHTCDRTQHKSSHDHYHVLMRTRVWLAFSGCWHH